MFGGAWFQTPLHRLGFCMFPVNIQVRIVLEVFLLVMRWLKFSMLASLLQAFH